jgi:hypothetical protein
VIEADAARKILKPRIGTERIETWPEQDPWVIPFLVTLIDRQQYLMIGKSR